MLKHDTLLIFQRVIIPSSLNPIENLSLSPSYTHITLLLATLGSTRDTLWSLYVEKLSFRIFSLELTPFLSMQIGVNYYRRL